MQSHRRVTIPAKTLKVDKCVVAGCKQYQHHIGNSIVFRFCLEHLLEYERVSIEEVKSA